MSDDWTVNTLKQLVEQRIAAVDARITAESTLQDAKWKAQDAHNLSSNEWRGTIVDLRRDFATRSEHGALETRFAADQLATARTLAQSGGEKQAAHDAMGIRRIWDTSIIGWIVAAAVAVLAFYTK